MLALFFHLHLIPPLYFCSPEFVCDSARASGFPVAAFPVILLTPLELMDFSTFEGSSPFSFLVTPRKMSSMALSRCLDMSGSLWSCEWYFTAISSISFRFSVSSSVFILKMDLIVVLVALVLFKLNH